ncbi:MAG: hypothetical protein JXA41_01000 [Deltaproteobacteria bacterium]|nr:hypothetical protein [Deltaproteobacteria bacterium]
MDRVIPLGFSGLKIFFRPSGISLRCRFLWGQFLICPHKKSPQTLPPAAARLRWHGARKNLAFAPMKPNSLTLPVPFSEPLPLSPELYAAHPIVLRETIND